MNIVLIEPEIPQNAGNIVRTCAATGCNLYMVKPLGFEVSDKHFKRAGLDYHDFANVKIVDSFEEIYTIIKTNNSSLQVQKAIKHMLMFLILKIALLFSEKNRSE